RLRDGVTVGQANRDISAIARRIHDESSEQGDYLLSDGLVVPLQESITGKARSPLLVLLGAVGFLLLVACANAANLMLAQLSLRERELAVRSALGAARGRLVRQILTEAFLLSIAGGAAGVLLALQAVALPWVGDPKARSGQATFFRRRDTAPRGRSAAGLLHSGAAGNESGPNGCVAVRVTNDVFSSGQLIGTNCDT